MTRHVQPIQCIGCPTGCGGEVIIEDGAVVERAVSPATLAGPTRRKRSSRQSAW